jgi:hypothetical protein
MSRSGDGGQTWSAAATNNAGVIGGQPVVRPDGTVVVPTANANETAVGAFNSTNGGASWSAVTSIATIRHHTVAGSLREGPLPSAEIDNSGTVYVAWAGEGPLPSAEIDNSGTVYVAWADCRFRRSCKANDIVLSHSLNATGTSWPSVAHVPTDATNSGIDHFIPGLAVNKTTSGTTAQLGLTYYFYPSRSTQLSVGFISSSNAGSTWGAPQAVASGMPSTWTATTSQGRMVGDYISTSYAPTTSPTGCSPPPPPRPVGRAAAPSSTTAGSRRPPSRPVWQQEARRPEQVLRCCSPATAAPTRTASGSSSISTAPNTAADPKPARDRARGRGQRRAAGTRHSQSRAAPLAPSTPASQCRRRGVRGTLAGDARPSPAAAARMAPASPAGTIEC